MYGFYNKTDENQEVIFKVDAKSKKQALEHFCFLKQMEQDQFQKLFEIIKVNE